MSLEPLVSLPELAALVGIRPGHPHDRHDLAVLAEMLARRTDAARDRTPRQAIEGEPGADRLAVWQRLLDDQPPEPGQPW